MLLEHERPWGVAPIPTSLLKKAGAKTFHCGYAAGWSLGVMILNRGLSYFGLNPLFRNVVAEKHKV
jgi:hypothetical protein